MGKSLLAWSLSEYFPDMGFVLWDVVRVDEDVVQVDDDNDVDHICEDVVHESLKSCWCISNPSGITKPLKEL